MTPQDERIKELEAKLVGAEYEREAMASLWYEGKKSMQDQLTEAQAEIERLRGAHGVSQEVLNWIGAIKIAPPISWPHYLVIADRANEALSRAEALAERKEEK